MAEKPVDILKVIWAAYVGEPILSGSKAGVGSGQSQAEKMDLWAVWSEGTLH